MLKLLQRSNGILQGTGSPVFCVPVLLTALCCFISTSVHPQPRQTHPILPLCSHHLPNVGPQKIDGSVLALRNQQSSNTDVTTNPQEDESQTSKQSQPVAKPSKVQLIVLGTAQDAGYPQAGCNKKCCQRAWENSELARMVSCIAVIDESTKTRLLFDCTPDFPRQLRLLDEKCAGLVSFGDTIPAKSGVDGIFLTHAHIGHYTGLMHLGREVMGSTETRVWAMPRMRTFLKTNGPWSQLVSLKNVELLELTAGIPVVPSPLVTVTPLQVPHRDEFSETVGFKIKGPQRTALFLPDIDKWSRWDESIEEVIASVDVAYIDGTFLENGEIPGRDMRLIPHPFITESINRFSALDETERNKVRFIHLNHTNPAIQSDSAARRIIRNAGMHVADQGERIEL